MLGNDASTVIDAYGGMITRKQAQGITDGRIAGNEDEKQSRDITTVAALLSFISAKEQRAGSRLFPESASSSTYTASIQDRIYRIFNPIASMLGSKQQERRTIVLGSEGSTIRLELRGRLSQYIDSNVFERGDLVMVRNAAYDNTLGALVAMQSTVISKIMPAQDGAITDYSKLREGMKNIDIIGKLMEIGPIRYVSRLGGSGQVAVSDCTLSDLEGSISISLWGSSALVTSRLNINDFVKVEFCSTVQKSGALSIYANEFSRVVASKTFEGRMRPSVRP
ncbi:MAG: hypothetical protein M1360_02680 [Candidatus Marsarchaeota archaeon]|jgi:hypothetical protein|nr:hypothetical protein [Candidatus Marsarchaeota archaeon]MCL5418822.1 hypothetical protein [Candidatus Marsarchaeota archaeon]